LKLKVKERITQVTKLKNQTLQLIAILFLPLGTCQAQQAWQVDAELLHARGNYNDSYTMNRQRSDGLRLSGEYQKQWGVSAGLVATTIDLNSSQGSNPAIHQQNWLLSSYLHLPSSPTPGRWTIQLDTHRIENDTKQGDSNGVNVIAPQIRWASASAPIILGLSYAQSHYKDSPATRQYTPSIGLGFNQNKYWLQVDLYAINHLDPSRALGQSSTRGTDIKLTQFLSPGKTWKPRSITVGIEAGKKFHAVNMTSQAVYNLPMTHTGGASINAVWPLGTGTALNLQLSKTRYFAEQLPFVPAHDFSLSTCNLQIKHTWH
jgi:hypothetical protein